MRPAAPVQNAPQPPANSAICTTRSAAIAPALPRAKIKPLPASHFPLHPAHWHGSRSPSGMTLLIVSFALLGALLCLLVSADEQAAAEAGTARVRTPNPP